MQNVRESVDKQTRFFNSNSISSFFRVLMPDATLQERFYSLDWDVYEYRGCLEVNIKKIKAKNLYGIPLCDHRLKACIVI